MFDEFSSSFGNSNTKNDHFTDTTSSRSSTGNCYNTAGTYNGQHTEEVPEVISFNSAQTSSYDTKLLQFNWAEFQPLD